MTDTDTTVTLTRREWRHTLNLMQRGLCTLDDHPNVQNSRALLYDRVEEQVESQYDGEPQTLDDMITHLEDEFDMDRSVAVEEIGRKHAHLRD